MSTLNPSDYVLGTGDEEIFRLGLQHEVWRAPVHECWRRAGIRAGSRVLDVGAGPGYATRDLAGLVGPAGAVIALERSPRFVAHARALLRERQISQVEFHELDLIEDAFPAAADGVDFAWCRWVMSFVSSPATLVRKLAAAVRPGGVAVFHEYAQYATWQLAPPCESHSRFVAEVMSSWRTNGGEPDIGLVLPTLLAAAGFRIRSVAPHIFAARPSDPLWEWPASFIESSLRRLVELGRVSESWAATMRADFARAADRPETVQFTPLVLEIIAERAG